MTMSKPFFRTRGGDHRPMNVREFVLKHLATTTEDTITHMRQVYLQEMDEIALAAGRKSRYHTASYMSFYKRVWELAKEGQIRKSGREELSTNPAFRSWAEKPTQTYWMLAR